MAESGLVKKLLIKAGNRLLIMNAPDDYLALLGEIPEGVEVSTAPAGSYDVVQVFVREKAEVDNVATAAIGAVKQGGVLWFSYPKKSSRLETDITRDIGWDAVDSAGRRPVTQVSIDEVWSALRMRPVADVGKPWTRDRS